MSEEKKTAQDEKAKKELPKFLQWVKKHIKLTIFIAVVLVIGVTGAVITIKVKQAMKEITNMVQTTEVKTMDISQTVSMTGTLEPVDTRTVSAQVNQIKIDSIEKDFSTCFYFEEMFH